MRKENQKEIYCTVKTDTSYGQNVLLSMEILKDRFGLSASRIIQDALLAYEKGTRETEDFYMKKDKEKSEDILIGTMNQEQTIKNEDSDMLGLLSSTDSSEYQM